MKARLLIVLAVVAITACGKTVFMNERFACGATADCADGYVCSAGECRTMAVADAGTMDAGRDAGPPMADGGAGSSCGGASECEASLTCVDGVCCRSACDAPCDSCAVPGSEGTCVTSPMGSESTGCGGYACDGTSTACATSCSGVNTCNPGYTCVSTTCGRCWSAVRSEFNLAIDPAWTLVTNADITGGTLNVAVTSRNGQSSETTATSAETLPLVGCGVTVELATAPAVVPGYTGRFELRANSVSQKPSFAWQFDTRGVVATWSFEDGTTGEQVVVPAGTTPPRWLRLEESNGEVLWRATSATTLSTLHTLPHSETLTGMKLEFSGRFPAQAGNQRVSFSIDSINNGP